MTGSTIDHLVATIVFLSATLLFISLFNQTIQTAVLYQRHRYLATKCSDLLDNMLLSPGIPSDWGTNSNKSLTGFGLQDPIATQDPTFAAYKLSPFSLMRLLSSASDRVYYGPTGKWYSNVSWGFGGGYFLLQEGDCINYSLASKLLGVNGTYGFQLTVKPTVTVTIVEDTQVTSHLRLNITVEGLGGPLNGANIEYLIFWTDVSGFYKNATKADALGFAQLDFDGTNGMPKIKVSQNQTAYTFIAKTNLGGLYGIGYLSREIVTKAGNIIPFIESYKDGIILLAHKWGKNDPGNQSQGDLHYEATFYILGESFVPVKTSITNSTGHVNYGQGWPYRTVQLPPEARSSPGFLVIVYRFGNEYGMVVMPWGIGTIGLSVIFGDDPSGKEWVATDTRQVLIGNIAYQAKLALWSLGGFQVVG